MSKVTFSARAREDLLEIWRYLEEHGSEAVADKVYDRIEKACTRLAAYPMSGRVRPEIHLDARSIVIDRWLALYRLTNIGAQVVRVLDGARDLSAITWNAD